MLILPNEPIILFFIFDNEKIKVCLFKVTMKIVTKMLPLNTKYLYCFYGYGDGGCILKNYNRTQFLSVSPDDIVLQSCKRGPYIYKKFFLRYHGALNITASLACQAKLIIISKIQKWLRIALELREPKLCA